VAAMAAIRFSFFLSFYVFFSFVQTIAYCGRTIYEFVFSIKVSKFNFFGMGTRLGAQRPYGEDK
jgi:hypothetical protein